MTRDEAIQKVTTALCKPNEPYWCPPGVALQDAVSDLARRAAEAVDIAVALGLKLDEPKTVRAAVFERLVNTMVESRDGNSLNEQQFTGRLTGYGAGCVLDSLEMAGFKIVRK